ncbi:MAG: alpha-L-fucosidase [Phycisphaerae bacterium]
MPDRLQWFRDARVGLFCHFGLYSLLGRGEWVMNRERILPGEYEKLADRFKVRKFKADDLTGLAQDLGAKYVVLTTKHHEGFCLYDSQLTDYTAVQRGPKRDLVREVVESCRKRGLKIGLYHTLNDWHTSPDATDALEDYTRRGSKGATYQQFIRYVHGQIREIMSNYGRIDLMWYDGWWPFDGAGWQGQKLNAMVRKLQPQILINNRNALPGDFGTPEQHATPDPKRMFEACFTLNDNWGYSASDQRWKSPREVVDLIIHCARHNGNLLINVGPKGDGSIPPPSVKILREVGRWVKKYEEALRPGLLPRPALDWNSFYGGRVTARKGVVYLHLALWPTHGQLTINGLKGKITGVRCLASGKKLRFTQTPGGFDGDRLEIRLPKQAPDPIAAVIALEHAGKISQYLTGGMRITRVEHCQYDPVQPDLLPH